MIIIINIGIFRRNYSFPQWKIKFPTDTSTIALNSLVICDDVIRPGVLTIHYEIRIC